MDEMKREMRRTKRIIKKAGSRHRRRELKRDLVENPEEAAHSEEKLGRNRSESYNGMDKDATRHRVDEE